MLPESQSSKSSLLVSDGRFESHILQVINKNRVLFHWATSGCPSLESWTLTLMDDKSQPAFGLLMLIFIVQWNIKVNQHSKRCAKCLSLHNFTQFGMFRTNSKYKFVGCTMWIFIQPMLISDWCGKENWSFTSVQNTLKACKISWG